MTSPPIRTLEINININKADTHAHAEVYLTRYVSRATWPVDVSLRKWLALASCKFARNFKDDAVGFFSRMTRNVYQYNCRYQIKSGLFQTTWPIKSNTAGTKKTDRWRIKELFYLQIRNYTWRTFSVIDKNAFAYVSTKQLNNLGFSETM